MKNKEKKELNDEEIEKILDSTWNNWESRRKCEQTHTPEYIKKKKDETPK